MRQAMSAHADTARLPFTQARIADSLQRLDAAGRRQAKVSANILIECLQDFARSGRLPLSLVVGHGTTATIMQHYQPAEASALDGTAGALHFFYHAHAMPGAVRAEHGHFHVFAQLGKDDRQTPQYAHLLGIAVDARGLPLRLFTTNRWVTDETWLPAASVLEIVRQVLRTKSPAEANIELWLRAQLGVFLPQIAELLQHRDYRLAAREQAGRRPGLLEDRRLQVLSQCMVSVEQQLSAFDRVIH
jgi:hypothetical protein